MIILALGHYHESLPDDHEDIDLLEEVMEEYGFFQDDRDTRPSLTVIAGEGTPKKSAKKPKLKLTRGVGN